MPKKRGGSEPGTAVRQSSPELLGDSRFLNRELSRLDFIERVLGLAEGDGRPPLERAKFIAITSSSLDEFFQIRVAGLKEQLVAGVAGTSADGMTPQEQLDAIRVQALELIE